MTTDAHGDRLDEWLNRVGVPENAVPMFATDDQNRVETQTYGYKEREVLRRSDYMEQMILREAKRVVEDFHSGDDEVDGLIHIILTYDNGNPNVRYVERVKKYTRDGERLSANLDGIEANKSKFARFGSGRYYHIGELSAVALDHDTDDSVDRDNPPTGRYLQWYDALFSDGLQLRDPVFLWTRAWESDQVGVHGLSTSLESLKHQIVEMASASPRHQLLNTKGVR